jgi:hypothetical protein
MNSNKLIAEFMGRDDVYQEMSEARAKRIYNYHTSWDWLIPVANEIIKSRDEQNADWDLTDLKYALCTTNIELVYEAVVEFIKEYNDGCHQTYNKYPFSEGDDYWVEEDGDLVWGVWDDTSEELHDENPNRQYFTEEEVMDHVRAYGVKLYK